MTDVASIEGEFDYIVVGAGSAGCVLANRLSADPKNRVLLLEAGLRDNWIWYHIPVGYLFAIGNPRSDWMFKTEPEPGLNGRSLNYPRGKVIGGSSAINAMVYMRGQAGDYDHWRQLGLPGWSWDDVLPYFKKHEDNFLGAERTPRRRRRMARRISAHSLGHHRRLARGGGAIRHCAGAGLQHRRQRGLLLFPRQPEARTALVGGARLPETGAWPAKPAPGNRLPGRRPAVRRQARRRRALAAGWRCAFGALPRRDHHGGRLDRFAANHDAVGRGTGGAACAIRDSPGARQARRRRQSARPSATAHDLQGDRHQNAKRNVFVAAGARLDGRQLCVVPARALDHGAVAARRLHQIRFHAGSRQSAVSHPAAVARQVRRPAASVPGHSPSASPMCGRPAAAA